MGKFLSDMSKEAKARKRAVLAKKDGWKCSYCGLHLIPDGKAGEICEKGPQGGYIPPKGYSFPHIDHKLPRSRGGTNDIENLVLSCERCNTVKNKKTVDEFEDWLSRHE